MTVRIRRSILQKQSLFVFALLTITASTLSIASHFVARGLLESQILAGLRVASAGRNDLLVAFVDQQKERVGLVSSRTRLRQLLASHSLAHGTLSEDQRHEFIAATQRILQDARNAINSFEEIWIADPTGRVITASDDRVIGRDIAADVDFQQGLREPHVGVPFLGTDGRLMAHLTGPVATDDQQTIGVVVVFVQASRLVQILERTPELTAGMEVLVGCRSGDKIRYLVPRRDGRPHEVGAADVPAMLDALAGNRGERIERYEGVPSLVVYGPLDYQSPRFRQWGIVASMPTSVAFAPLTTLGFRFALLDGALILSAVGLSLLAARRFTRPITELSRLAAAFAAGDFSARARHGSIDELGDLAIAFNTMADKLASTYTTLEQEVAERTADLVTANRKLMQEIEERKRAEWVAEEARRQAESANRAKSAFLAGHWHDGTRPGYPALRTAEGAAGNRP